MQASRVRALLGESLAKLLLAIGAEAERERSTAYLIGGAVRDLLLGIPSADIDILVEGDAIVFARSIAARWDSLFPEIAAPEKPAVFRRYGTAKLSFSQEIAPGVTGLDFATARAEVYPAPGKPPIISWTDLPGDLRRRDFSVNALALSLSPSSPFALIDTVGGERDLEHGILRIFHERSFLDDPARILRAMRFAARFDFVLEHETEAALQEALGQRALDLLPRNRLLDELRKALEEKEVSAVVTAMDGRGVLAAIHPGFRLSATVGQYPQWEARLRSIAAPLSDQELADFLRQAGVNEREVWRRFLGKEMS